MGSAISTIIGFVDWTSTPDLKSADDYRKQAHTHFDRSKQLSIQSQQAFKSGDKPKAKSLSIEKQFEWANGEQLNLRASAIIFKHFNPDAGSSSLSVIDLHGLFVKEAEKYLDERLAVLNKKSRRGFKLVVVTGQGNHSQRGVAVIKPFIQKYAEERGWIIMMKVTS